MGRRIFVGDVQGCREELERLLEAVAFDPAGDTLLPVGDLVNRGPDSLGVLRLARELGARPVLGNHDLHLLHTAAGTRAAKRRDTLDDVLAAPDRDELLAWLAAQPFVRVEGDALVVHAALHPRWEDPVGRLAGADPYAPDADALFACRTRYCDAGGGLPERDDGDPGPPYRPWFEHPRAGALDGRTVVFGHWSVRGLVVEPGLRGLDTGCVWGRELTAWIAEEDRVVQVEAARTYCEIS